MKIGVVVGALLTGCMLHAQLQAQSGFVVHDRHVQIHGFLSEAVACTDNNNYLRMSTSEGSLFTEGGVNASAQITGQFRLGAQIYDRDIGELGRGHVYLDWAFADYRFKDWLGVRAGKVKTSLGLHTDTQDQEFLHTWALLPQAVYPLDLRSVTAAHIGGDLYGHVDLPGAGSIAYTAYAGSIPTDQHGGYLYGIEAVAGHFAGDVSGRMAGLDVRWSTPISGLMMGTSFLSIHRHFTGTFELAPFPLSYSTTGDRVQAFFGEYTQGDFHTEAEYRNERRRGEINGEIPGRPLVGLPGSDEPAWFTAAAYRFSKWFEAGAYYSHYRVDLIDPITPVIGPGRDHIYDKTVTLRFDLTRFWDLKVEGHFMDGVGSPTEAHGFYPQDNPDGFNPATNMLVVRTGWYF